MFAAMRSIVLTTAFSVATFFSVLTFLEKQDNTVYDCRLPEIQIKAKRIEEKMPNVTLPEITIRAARHRIATLPLPEVVVTARQSRA